MTQNVIFKLKYLYSLGLILPIAVIGACWGCFYGLKHYDTCKFFTNFKFVPTISESVVEFPECRIFSTGMTITAFVQAAVFFFRDHIIHIIAKNKLSTFGKTLVWLARIFGTLAPIGLIVLSNFFIDKYWYPHMVGAGVYFLSSYLYFLCCDVINIIIKRPHWFSLSVTIFGLVGMTIQFTLRGPLLPDDRTRWTVSSIFQYLCVLTCGVKNFLTIWDFPGHGIKFSEKK